MNKKSFSVICVYNNKEVLEEYLITGLDSQTVSDFEKVLINNTEGNYRSAAEALNAGARKASGEYYMFIHQDVKLPEDYLERAKTYLDSVDMLGVAGAAGVRATVECEAEAVNEICHGPEQERWKDATPISNPTEVTGLDEMLLIVPASVFKKEPFSESICKGWHLYGVEYSIRMQKKGKRVVVLPIELWHRSAGGWRDWKHDITLLRIIRRYPELECIHTTGGSWPAKYWFGLFRLIVSIGHLDSLPVKPDLGIRKKL